MQSKIEHLHNEYAKLVKLPWQRTLAGPQRVWFVIYDPKDERRLRLQVGQYALTTRQAGKGWAHLDLTDAFARWMGRHPYAEAYFKAPSLLNDGALVDFQRAVSAQVRALLTSPDATPDTVVALSGTGALYSFMHVSHLVREVEADIRGHLLVFYPGAYRNNNYRLLDARDGWNYLALPIAES